MPTTKTTPHNNNDDDDDDNDDNDDNDDSNNDDDDDDDNSNDNDNDNDEDDDDEEDDDNDNANDNDNGNDNNNNNNDNNDNNNNNDIKTHLKVAVVAVDGRDVRVHRVQDNGDAASVEREPTPAATRALCLGLGRSDLLVPRAHLLDRGRREVAMHNRDVDSCLFKHLATL